MVLLLFVAVGAFAVDSSNWTPFVPANDGDFGDFGASGVIRGAGVVFFAYVGFDAVSTAAGEARNPQRTVPIGLLADRAHLDGAVRRDRARADRHRAVRPPQRGRPALEGGRGRGPRRRRGSTRRSAWRRWSGLFSTVLVTFYGQTRILMRMSADGMLPPIFNRVDQRFKTPVFTTILCGVAGGAVAALVPIDVLGRAGLDRDPAGVHDRVRGVLVLRRTHPDVERPFRVPHVNVVAGLGLLSALGLMVTLPIETWIRLAIWLVIGLTIFFTYARSHTTR